VIPEPIRTCQCKGPECVAVAGLRSLPCKNEMTSEDLLCEICREFRGKKHCHFMNKLCPVMPIEPYMDYTFRGMVEYVDRRYRP
jgi:hypothetical protein